MAEEQHSKNVSPSQEYRGYCLSCGKASKTPFCNRKCYLDYVRKNGNGLSRKEREKRSRNALTDVMVRKAIYIQLNKKVKGTIRYSDITPEMIVEKRAAIIYYRKHGHVLKNAPSCKVFFRVCEECGEQYTAKNSLEKYCSKKCKNTHHTNRTRERYELRYKSIQKCKQCGAAFYGYNKNAYCSIECADVAKRSEKPKRKATRLGVYYEPVDPLKVFKRDGWKCQLCGKKLSMKDRGKGYDNSPELDHIIPWGKGGEHSYRNTQLACRKCNGEKGDKELGQQRLFG